MLQTSKTKIWSYGGDAQTWQNLPPLNKFIPVWFGAVCPVHKSHNCHGTSRVPKVSCIFPCMG